MDKMIINSHIREGVRLLLTLLGTHGLDYFNPRTPAKECDVVRQLNTLEVHLISIHAPPRRSATRPNGPSTGHQYQISIHAPPRRSATPTEGSVQDVSLYFNPRTPAKECDQVWLTTRSKSRYFNPRTPAKECDAGRVVFLVANLYFNPRTPAKECDEEIPDNVNGGTIFQSTHPREGVRPEFFIESTYLDQFQSTHPREGVRPTQTGR